MPELGADTWLPPDQALLDELKHRGISWWGGYVGGAGLYLGTPWPHDAWRLCEDNGIAPLPIYVPDQALHGMSAHDAAMEAIDLVDAAGMMGAVAVDSEQVMASVMNFQGWLDEWCHEVIAAGWDAVCYAGAHYVPGGAFPWLVHWGEPSLVPGTGTAYQYGPYTILGRQVDADNAGDGFPFAQYHGAPAPVPLPPPPAADPLEAALANFPILALGASGGRVREVQGLLCAWGWHIAIDGDYGPITEATCRTFQGQHGLGTDGKCGPLTMTALIS